ncbi:hypothetical protein [Cupriavidus sp. AU9028]|nr:hypothetical protein [Cupriavidus sp. AU9028]
MTMLDKGLSRFQVMMAQRSKGLENAGKTGNSGPAARLVDARGGS